MANPNLILSKRPQASFLLSSSPPVLLEFAKIALGIVLNGDTVGKGYSNAANKLQVTAEAVEQGVLMLCDIIVRAARSKLSTQEMLDVLMNIGFEEASRVPLAEYFAQRLGHIREVVAISSLRVPFYRSLEWRLDVQVGSRSLRNQASPSFLLKLSTSSNDGEESTGKSREGAATVHLEADYVTLKAVCGELEQALAEIRSTHNRRVTRQFK